MTKSADTMLVTASLSRNTLSQAVLALSVTLSAFLLWLSSPLPSKAADTAMAHNRLQWILAVPDEHWRGRVGELAMLLDQQDHAAADTVLKTWLENDFYSALLALPSMQYFDNQFQSYSFEPMYVASLKRLSGAERFEHLAQLDLQNEAVFAVGVAVLSDWWASDPETMKRWVTDTPGLTDDIYLDAFIERDIKTQQDLSSWVELLWKLDDSDTRKKRFFGELFSELADSDLELAIEFANNAKVGQSEANSYWSDQVALRLAYHFGEVTQQATALNWLSQVGDKERKDVMIRDLILNSLDMASVHPYVEWLGTNQVKSRIVKESIDEHVSSLEKTSTSKSSGD